MSIYLIKKTHRITGLKYLCKTIRSDWHKYSGSGKYWKQHLKIHGKEIDSELIKECHSPEEFKIWGIYYSNLWNIVNEVDENGKKTWANLKPEEGDGGDPGPIGRQKLSEAHSGVKHSAERNARKSKRQKGLKKSQQWINNRKPYSKTIYCWENILSGEKVNLTRAEFLSQKLSDIDKGTISTVINGKQKSIKGWRIVR